MTNRQIVNGYIESIDIMMVSTDHLERTFTDYLERTFVKFTVIAENRIPVLMYEFNKPSWELPGLNFAHSLMEFFNVNSWGCIRGSRTRIMLEDDVLVGIGKWNRDDWLEVFPWNIPK